MPSMPISASAVFTSSSLNGLMMAMMSFMSENFFQVDERCRAGSGRAGAEALAKLREQGGAVSDEQAGRHEPFRAVDEEQRTNELDQREDDEKVGDACPGARH